MPPPISTSFFFPSLFTHLGSSYCRHLRHSYCGKVPPVVSSTNCSRTIQKAPQLEHSMGSPCDDVFLTGGCYIYCGGLYAEIERNLHDDNSSYYSRKPNQQRDHQPFLNRYPHPPPHSSPSLSPSFLSPPPASSESIHYHQRRTPRKIKKTAQNPPFAAPPSPHPQPSHSASAP